MIASDKDNKRCPVCGKEVAPVVRFCSQKCEDTFRRERNQGTVRSEWDAMDAAKRTKH